MADLVRPNRRLDRFCMLLVGLVMVPGVVVLGIVVLGYGIRVGGIRVSVIRGCRVGRRFGMGLIRCLTVQFGDRLHRPERQRLMERELVLQVDGDPHEAPLVIGFVEELEDAGIDQGAIDRDRPADVATLTLAGLVVVGQQATDVAAAVARAVEHRHHHLMVHVKVRPQLLRLAVDEFVEHVPVPGRVVAVRCLLLDDLLASAGIGLFLRSQVLHHVLGSLHPHVTTVIESLASGASGDLRELAVRQNADRYAVVLAELGEQHRPDRHVHPDTECVGAADDLQQTVLRQFLDEQPILGEQACVVHADAGGDEPFEVLADRRVEAEVADRFAHQTLLGLGERIEGDVALGGVGCVLLREVDDVDRCPTRLKELVDAVVQRRGAVLEMQRHGPLRRADDRHRAIRSRLEIALEEPDVAERCRHQDELHVGEFEEGELPGPAPLRIAVVVELVDHNEVDVGAPAVAQRLIGEDLGRAADDRCVGVDRSIAGDHPDVVRAEVPTQCEELFADERLDRRGVVAAPARCERGEVRGGRDERLARPRRRVDDHVVAEEEFEHGFLLSRVHLDADLVGVRREAVEHGVVVGATVVAGVGKVTDQWRCRVHAAARCTASNTSLTDGRSAGPALQ